MGPRNFAQHLNRSLAAAPVGSAAFSALSDKTRNRLLSGHDPVVLLEAASSVLSDIENKRFENVLGRLPLEDQRTVTRWYERVRQSGQVAPTPVLPLGLLAATTLGLGLSEPGVRTDEVREQLADQLVRVGLRFNDSVVGNDGADSADRTLEYMARSALWRAVEDDSWMVWSGELMAGLTQLPAAEPVLQAFLEAADISVAEWWSRGLGERATRQVHGARSWGPPDTIEERIERGWSELTTAPLSQVVQVARDSLVQERRSRPWRVADPFDLLWMTTRPVVEVPDGRRFQIWLGANNRSLLPSVAAQVVADTAGLRYDRVAALLGKVGESLLTSALDALPAVGSEVRVPESAMPTGTSRCDYLIKAQGLLLGLEFTLMTPTRALSAGDPAAVEKLVDRLAGKFRQVYRTFKREDPAHLKRWVPVVVLVSPSVVDPLLNSRVHRSLEAMAEIPADEDDELITCHAPDFLDLLEYVRRDSVPLSGAIVDWLDGPQRGTGLDWWLGDRAAHRSSMKIRIDEMTEWVESALAPS